jgi:hypothetical protein
MNDKTLMIAALGVGAFLLTRRNASGQTALSGTAAQRFFTNTNQSPARASAGRQLDNNQAQIYGAAGGLLGKLFGSLSGASAGGYLTPTPTNIVMSAADDTPFSLTNYGDATIPTSPYGIYGIDSAAYNPPGNVSPFDAFISP